MRSILFTLSMALTITLAFSGIPQAKTTTTQVTNNSYEDSLPRINGNYIVWQAYSAKTSSPSI